MTQHTVTYNSTTSHSSKFPMSKQLLMLGGFVEWPINVQLLYNILQVLMSLYQSVQTKLEACYFRYDAVIHM